jgi:C1A family cysteine protease
MADSLTLEEVQEAIAQNQARWTAENTPLSRLPPDRRRLRSGYNPPDGGAELSLRGRERRSAANRELPSAADGYPYPMAFDLRSVQGVDFTSSIKDQRDCRSCVAFGVIATVEAATRVQSNQPGLMLDFSEGHLYHCHGGVSCNSGWLVGPALEAFKQSGVIPEVCRPYNTSNELCNPCPTWNQQLTKIADWQHITDTDEMRSWISTKGPLVTCMTAYEDFTSFYGGGVYTHVAGASDGGHCVSCVGYDHAQQYWICQNSVGTNWGDNGFFRIAYAEAGIDAEMWGVIV